MPTSEARNARLKKLKGEDGVKDQYMEFVVQAEEEMTILSKKSKKEVVI